MRPRTLVVLCVVVAAVAALISVPLAFADHGLASANPSSTIGPTGSPRVAAQAAPPPPTLLIPKDPASITAPGTKYLGWYLIDRKTGKTAGSSNAESSTNTTESMIKAWIAADYLRNHASPSKSVLNDLNNMIIHSDDNIAEKYYKLNGGDSSITQLISLCGLTDTQTPADSNPSLPTKWSYTEMSPADAARMGLCIAEGKAAGPQWTSFLLTSMRSVQGSVEDQQVTTGGGHWGIIDGLPSYLVPTTSIKNGWTAQVYDHNWHVNCLAINTNWVLAIEMHYPWTSPTGNWHQADNLAFGANTCAAVTKQLVGVPDTPDS